MVRYLLVIALFFAGCSSCGDDAANSGTLPDAGIRTEQDAGSGPCQGCFDESDECQEGKSDDLCGAGGTQCRVCEGGTSCNDDGECVQPPSCTPDTCDGCCTAADECVTGDSADACGANGSRCSECPQGGACTAGACSFGCGPDNCNGCCDAQGDCQAGDADAVCGTGGGACSDCSADGSVCGGGACVATDCAQTCAGCCDGAQCVDPATDQACGGGGAACLTCTGEEACVAGTCTAPDRSRWDVVLISADIPSTKLSGAGWDTFGGLPDVVAWVYALDPVTSESWLEQSSIKDETLTPEWNETLLDGVTTAALTDRITFEFWDYDAAFDDEICIMDIEVDASMMNGQVIETPCDYDPEMRWRWRLEAVP